MVHGSLGSGLALPICLTVILGLALGPPAKAEEVLTNESVITMVRAGLPESVIVAKIRSTETKFDMSTEGLIALKRAGVPDRVLEAMVAREQPGSAIAGTPSPAPVEERASPRPSQPEARSAGEPVACRAVDGKELKRVTEFPKGKQTDVLVSAFLSGFEMSNAEEMICRAPQQRVWAAAKAVALQLDKIGGRELVSAREEVGRIQNGKISDDASLGVGQMAIFDEIYTEVTQVGADETKITVLRRVVQPILKRRRGGYEREWRSAKSNGEIEHWVLTRIEADLNSTRMPTSETR